MTMLSKGPPKLHAPPMKPNLNLAEEAVVVDGVAAVAEADDLVVEAAV